ncbi:hypothetical protein JVT61DRAFT_7408 [Boletus reticuloceps]|uniref:FHA domain-containing protein n=1 Tax=Boletus reticuloceps TaxID=495285 RepID=A0A8I2YIH4_9AGAM|nr:hypothetical protein JVT61DRAFT_7408 [Boletus reticuloceps]
MWLLTGPFDSGTGDVTTTKTKLVKTGRKIGLGRKEKHLTVNNKKISRDHCEFVVGPCSQDDVANPSFVPTLEIYNAKEKPMSIDRDGQPVIVNPLSSSELKSGDRINIVVGVSVQVQWRRVACFLPPARSLPSISREDCAELGIGLMTSPTSLATHHLTPKYELTVPLATSLLSATQLVKAEWLQELIRLGTTPDESHPFKLAPLEQSFTPPLESKYRPAFSPSLATSLKSFKFWEPNEERLHLLKGYRFVLLSDAEGQVDADTRELIVRGDGEYECFPLTNGEAKWRQMLGKAKRKVDEAGLKVAIVAREHVIQATVGVDKWREMTAGAQSLSLPLVNLDTLMNTVINTDALLMNAGSSSQAGVSAESESPLPDFVPNTHPSEPSLPVAPEKAPTEPNEISRKSPSPSPPPMLYGLPIPPPPSKTLIRRPRPPSTTSRTEEPVASNVKEETQAENLGYTLPPLPEMTRSSRLKRRTPAPAPSVEEPVAEHEPSQEPPLKKFKALFDASNPDKLTVDSHDIEEAYDVALRDSVGVTQVGESLTQSDSRVLHSQIAAPSRTLDAVAEEEEESVQSQPRPTAPAPTLPRSRRKTPLPQETQESRVDAIQGTGTNSKPPSKQIKSKTAQSHQIDTDPAFLTALASRKGRKKTAEDNFDREFNNLRISKPDIRREEEQEWEILGDFDTEARSLRGNFMVVMDLDVFRRNSGHITETRAYEGRPNYKKFKKTPIPSSRAPIELVANAEHDYGLGSGYWKDGAMDDEDTLAATQTAATQKRRAPTVLESDGADSDVPAVKSSKKAVRKAPHSKGRAAAKKLFLSSDEEDPAPEAKPPETARKPHTGKIDFVPNLPTRGSKRRHIIVDDDSDDGVAFKGFGKKRRV